LHELVKFFGGITACAGAAGVALAVYLKLYPDSATVVPSAVEAAIYGVSVLISGALLYCLGAIVDHLKAIRDFQRRQVEVFERMGKNRASSMTGPTTLSAPSSPVVTYQGSRPTPGGGEGGPRQDDENKREPLRKQAS
jgi:hypothetical protein